MTNSCSASHSNLLLSVDVRNAPISAPQGSLSSSAGASKPPCPSLAHTAGSHKGCGSTVQLHTSPSPSPLCPFHAENSASAPRLMSSILSVSTLLATLKTLANGCQGNQAIVAVSGPKIQMSEVALGKEPTGSWSAGQACPCLFIYTHLQLLCSLWET